MLTATLTGASPLELPAPTVQASTGGAATPVELDPGEVAFLQGVAAATVAAEPGRPRPAPAEPDPADIALELLRESALFDGAAAADVAGFAARNPPRPLPAGSVLFAAGQRDDTAHIVLDGVLEVCGADGSTRRPSPGRVAMAATLGAEALLGEPHRETAVLRTPGHAVPVTLPALGAFAGLAARVRNNARGL